MPVDYFSSIMKIKAIKKIKGKHETKDLNH
jgi:hypothetical protein